MSAMSRTNKWIQQFTAQDHEDKWLCDRWAELRLPEFGYFVEFGAGDGKTLSNTWWLEHHRGWHGLLCEPEPRNLAKISRRSRPRSVVEPVCVGPAGTVLLGVCD